MERSRHLRLRQPTKSTVAEDVFNNAQRILFETVLATTADYYRLARKKIIEVIQRPDNRRKFVFKTCLAPIPKQQAADKDTAQLYIWHRYE